jgi:hypothetical protein
VLRRRKVGGEEKNEISKALKRLLQIKYKRNRPN